MRPAFPGMDPWLEHPAFWPDVHNRLVVSIADDLASRLAPRYYTRLDRRTYLVGSEEPRFVGVPDLAVIPSGPYEAGQPSGAQAESSPPSSVDVLVPLIDEVEETFLEIHQVGTGKLITIVELLSPANKLHRKGRAKYLRKRDRVFLSRTSLVEIDLHRAGTPMPLGGTRRPERRDYRILVSPGSRRPHARLLSFGVRQPIPSFALPLLPGEDEPILDLGAVLHALYERARFDLGVDYSTAPVPPLSADDAAWARGIIAAGG